MAVIALHKTEELSETEQIDKIFAVWQHLHTNGRSRLDDRRRKTIRTRLQDGFTIDDMTDAIYGCYLSAFHMGDNDRRTRYNDICLILRDAEHVDRFIAIYEDGQSCLQKSRQKTAQIEISRGEISAQTRAKLDQIRKLLK